MIWALVGHERSLKNTITVPLMFKIKSVYFDLKSIALPDAFDLKIL